LLLGFLTASSYLKSSLHNTRVLTDFGIITPIDEQRGNCLSGFSNFLIEKGQKERYPKGKMCIEKESSGLPRRQETEKYGI